jgi:hypothetical protein
MNFAIIFRLAPYALLVFLAGAFDGLNQTLLFHYGKFAERFPDASAQYWNPMVSWTNKGDNILMRTVFVSLTDAYHFTRSFHWMLLVVSVIGLCEFRRQWPFMPVLFYFALVTFVYTAKACGFHFVYTILFR